MPGRIFRSDYVDEPTADDRAALTKLRIRAIFDLRRPEERSVVPSRFWSREEANLRSHDVAGDLRVVW